MAADFQLGTDPEAVFVIKKTGTIRSPSDIIYDPDPHDVHGKATAVGKDGDRPTSSFELRPGRSDSGEVLVNRLADLIFKLHRHYHPAGVAYRAGAYYHPEPLGGHIHLSWPDTGGVFGNLYTDMLWRVCEILKGFRASADFMMPKLFKEEQLVSRVEWARAQKRDFAFGLSIRPGTLDAVMKEAHVEYRYPPSWLDTPEAAYCFLGGAEFIVREVLDTPVGKARDWSAFAERMFTDAGMAPPNSPSLATALKVATRFAGSEDFALNWVNQ